MKSDLWSELLAGDAASLDELNALSTALPTQAPRAGARERLLAAAREPSRRWAPFFDRLTRLFELDEAALVAIAERAARADEWEEAPLPGVRLFHFEPGPALAAADAGLVRIE